MNQKRTKFGDFDRTLSRWGQLLTSDHVDSKARKMLGLIGEKEAFVIKDMFSGLGCMYAVNSKNGADTEVCIRDFAGIPGIREAKDINMYSDQSGEIRLACKNIGVLHDKSQPGVLQNNAFIDRTNQTILTLTLTPI